MLLYPVLEWWFNVAINLPTIIWGIVIIGLIVLGIFGFSEIRNALFTILAAPIWLYLLCYVCKAAQTFPLVGWFFVIIRLVVDISIIGGIVMAIRYFMVK